MLPQPIRESTGNTPFFRRDLLKGAAAGAIAVAAGSLATRGPSVSVSAAQNTSSGDLILANAKFVDGRGQVANALTVRNSRIASVGKAAAVAPDARTIDLGGRPSSRASSTARPLHASGVNPGYEARRIERAFSIASCRRRSRSAPASVPPGQFITCIGGWNHTQFARRAGRRSGTRRGGAQTRRLHFRHRRRHRRDHQQSWPGVLRSKGVDGGRGHGHRRCRRGPPSPRSRPRRLLKTSFAAPPT